MATIEQLEHIIEELERKVNVALEKTNQLQRASEKALDTAMHAYKLDEYGYLWAYEAETQTYRKTKMRVATPEIINEAIKPIHIAPGAVTGDKLENGAIIPGKIADAAVTTRTIQDKAITPEKLSPEVLMGLVYDMGVDDDGTLWVVLGNPKGPDVPEEDWQRMSFHDYNARSVMVAADLEGEVCPVELQENGECTVLYRNATQDQDFTVSIASRYKTAEGEEVQITVPAGGYAEVSYLKSGGEIYVRGV